MKIIILLLCIFMTRAEFCRRDKIALQRQSGNFLGHTQFLQSGLGHAGKLFHAVLQLGPGVTTDNVTLMYYDCADATPCDVDTATDITIAPSTYDVIAPSTYDVKSIPANGPFNHVLTKVVVSTLSGDHIFYEETYLCRPGNIPTATTGCVQCAVGKYAVLGQSTCTDCPSGKTSIVGSSECTPTRRLGVVSDTLCIKKEIMYGNLNQLDETGRCNMACVDVTGIQSPSPVNLPVLSANAICAEIINNGLYYSTKDCMV